VDGCPHCKGLCDSLKAHASLVQALRPAHRFPACAKSRLRKSRPRRRWTSNASRNPRRTGALSCRFRRHGTRLRQVGPGRFRSGLYMAPVVHAAAQIAGVEATLAQDAHGNVARSQPRSGLEWGGPWAARPAGPAQLAERNMQPHVQSGPRCPLETLAHVENQHVCAAISDQPARGESWLRAFCAIMPARFTGSLAAPFAGIAKLGFREIVDRGAHLDRHRDGVDSSLDAGPPTACAPRNAAVRRAKEQLEMIGFAPG